MHRVAGIRGFLRGVIGLSILLAALPALGASNPALLPEAGPVVEEVSIPVEASPGDDMDWAGLARGLVLLPGGGTFSTDRLRASIEALELCGRFRSVDARSEPMNGGVRIIFTLVPHRLIRVIRVRGAYPLFEGEILNRMTIYPGDAFVEEVISEQAELVARLFRREGYPDAKVEVSAEPDADARFVVIGVRIDKGGRRRMKSLAFEGNRAFSDWRLRWKTKTGRMGLLPLRRFVEPVFKKDVGKVVQFYRSKGYAESIVDTRFEEDPDDGSVDMVVAVVEGPRYKVDFSGNEHFWDRTLRKDLVIFTRGNRNDLGLKKSARKMKERYREAGFPEAKVRFEEVPTAGEEGKKRVIRFIIDEGPRSIVESIRIEGNEVLDDKAIRGRMFTRPPGLLHRGAFVPETLDEDLIAIRSLYVKNGFMDAEIGREVTRSADGGVVIVGLTIKEGPRTIVSSGTVTGTGLLSEAEIAKALALKAGKPFRKYMVKEDEKALAALISEKGYPHVEVSGDFSVNEDHSEAAVVYRVDEGSPVVMGEAWYNGNFRTKEKILNREFEMKPGDPFSLKRMLEGQRNIRDLDIFHSVQFKTIGLREEAEKISLFVEVEEEKPYFAQAGGGYETERGLFAHARAGDHNLLGTNKDLWVGGEVSEIGYRGETGFTESRLLGTRVSMNLGLFAEDRAEFIQDFGTRVYGASVGFVRELLDHLTLGLHVRYERRDQYRRSPDIPLAEEFDPRGIIVTTPSIGFDTRDSFIRPRRGILSSISVEVSKGLDNDLDDFIKYNADLRFYWTPIKRLTLAWLGRAGYIDPYGGADKVPEDQLFFLGGTADVRGFDENMLRFDVDGEPLGARLSAVGSMEARVDLGLNFEFTGFFDAGGLMSTFEEAGSESFRPSAGAGLRYVTPIGPIGFLYGFKIDGKAGESLGRLHFSLGYTF